MTNMTSLLLGETLIRFVTSLGLFADLVFKWWYRTNVSHHSRCRNAGFSNTASRHDDITYESIAKAFGVKIKLYEEAYQRMRKLSKPQPGKEPFNWDVDSPAKKAKLRMVELPTDDSIPLEKQFLFPREDLWVPVAVVNGNVHILPGVPRLCQPPSSLQAI